MWQKGLEIVLIAFFSLAACQSNTFQEGERLYKANCANCHLDDGKGLGALIPPLAGADYLSQNRERLACILRHGLNDTIIVNGVTYAEKMPGVPTLTDIQVANLLNFINNSWGNKNGVFRLDEVRKHLEKCQR